MLASITTRSSSASIQINGLATKYTTAKWPISTSASACYSGWIGVILVLLQNLIVTTKIGWKGLLTQWLMCWILCLEFWFRDLAWSFSCVVWQETFLLNASLSTRSINGYWQIVSKAWWNTGGLLCKRLASHSGGRSNTPSHSMQQKLGLALAGWTTWVQYSICH